MMNEASRKNITSISGMISMRARFREPGGENFMRAADIYRLLGASTVKAIRRNPARRTRSSTRVMDS